MSRPDEPIFSLLRGSQPLLVSLPHVGTVLPDWLQAQLAERAKAVEDTDWHLERLYSCARELGASILVPRFSRYLVDLNRPPENEPMYPGVNNTGLCPTHFFTGEPLYLEAQQPDAAEVQRRVQAYWKPYHDALKAELQRIRTAHGHVVLFDGHSIKSELPWLFDGRLWDLNLGTSNCGSCHAELRAQLTDVLQAQSAYSQVVDGRFKGGYITRHYGKPQQAVHAVQLEMTWRCYMEETPPFAWHDTRAQRVQPLLRELLTTMLRWKPQ
jgi:N-formylglutamate deformylase